MITDILGGKTGAADAASSAKQAMAGRMGSDAPSNGFSEALSGFDQDAAARRETPQDETSTSGEGGPDAENGSARPKPIIDIKPESLLRYSQKAELVSGAAKPESVRSTDERFMTAAEKKLRDALAAAKALVRKADELNAGRRSDVCEHDMPTDDVDLSILEADDAKIADVLSFLNGSGLNAGEVLSSMSKNGAQAQKRQKDSDARLDGVDTNEAGEVRRFRLADSGMGDPLSPPVDSDVADRRGREFRFTSARDENQSVSLAIEGGRAGETAEFKSSSKTGAENVTVLDSRRYLGLAPNSNSANLTAALASDPDWAAAMHPSSALSNAAAQSSTGSVVNTLKLQMNPHDLGSVTATLRLHGEELNVHLTVETRAAYRQLSDDSGGIVDALRAQGFSVDQVTISIAPTADSDATGSQQQGQSGQAGQQAAAEGGRQGQLAGREQGHAARQSAEQGARNMDDPVPDNASAASGNSGPGHLYL